MVTSKRRFFQRDQNVGFLFTLPFTIGFFVFTVVPIAYALYYSLTNYDVLTPSVFVGLNNYINLFTGDAVFWQSLRATTIFSLVSVPLRLMFALFVALLMLRPSRLSSLYRAVYYMPSIMGGSVAIAIVWRRFFASNGTLNALLGLLGISSSYAWLGHPNTAMLSLILLDMWQFGSAMLIFLAALKQIPQELYEAADVDGAKRSARFFRITLPMLTPTIFFNLIMQIISAFLQFTKCYIITEGKPLNSTLFYVVNLYYQAFKYYHMGYACAMAVFMLVLVGGITYIMFVTKKRWVYEV
ncbi:MAG: sugar ABC transporter permease [Eubacteriales bacterium]|nr:sugar ABC transporter permease [Eubacteriales bacterium]